ncbi:MAG: OmpH family outer membrane protein [Deltaproteobacteria bacterium]|nr:OmpH family outer membrane protein [Deltaproteobacteria bacterium]
MKTMKKVFIAACLAVFAAAAGAHAAEIKIAHANLQRALNECEAGKKAKDILAEEAKKYADLLDAKQEDLKKLKEEIDKKSNVWSKEAKEAKETEFMQRSQEFERLYEEYGKQLNDKKLQREDEIINGLRKTVDEIAKKKGYTYVFERSVGGLLYAPETDDITDEVIKQHNKKFKAKE